MSWPGVPFAAGPLSPAHKGEERVKAGKHDFGGVLAGGLVVQAQDTGRVLMIQRLPDKHDEDAAYARWEWPGGCLDEQDPGVWQGALREWEEETGSALDSTAGHAGSFLSHEGEYQAYVIRVPSESGLVFEPQPEEVADIGWWDPADLAGDSRVRDKVRDNLDLLAPFLQGSATVTKVMSGVVQSQEAWDRRLFQGRQAASKPYVAPPEDLKFLAGYHRNSDRIVAYYGPLLVNMFAGLLSDDDLVEVIRRAVGTAPGVIEQIAHHHGVEGQAAKATGGFVASIVSWLSRKASTLPGLRRLLPELWGDAGLQAAHFVAQQVGDVGERTFAPLFEGLPDDYWDSWQPGWGDAAARLADGGLRRMLDQAGVEIRSIVSSRLNDLGELIGRGVLAGDSVDRIARDCQDMLTAPWRAKMIANTEMCRAMTVQTIDGYRAGNVQLVRWLAEGDACAECAEMADSGAMAVLSLPEQPPAHPNCRCCLAPVVDEGQLEEGGRDV